MATGDGSCPYVGEFPEVDAKPRTHPVVTAGFTTSNFGTGPAADDYAEHARAAAQVAAAVNAGMSDGSAPARGLEEYVAGKTSRSGR